MNIHDVRLEFRDEMIILPKFIDGKSSIHNELWNLICQGNTILLQLVVDTTKRATSIERAVIRFDKIVLDAMDMLNKEDQMQLAIYFTSMLKYIHQRCEDNERYEACANIKAFSDTYFENMMRNDAE